MNRPRALQLMLGLPLIMLLVGCRTTASNPVSEASAPTSTLGPATAVISPEPPTPTPFASPTIPPPELPTATPTPIAIPPTPTPVPPTETPTIEAVQPQQLSNLSKIVFAADNNIYSVDVNTRELTKLAQVDETLCCPRWSQDGQQIDFVYGNTWFVDEDSSPDGQRIAFVVRKVENDNPVAELYVKNADGTDVTKLTTPLSIRGIDW